MSALEKIAFFQNIRNEIPNQQLARILAAAEDVQGIQEIAENLTHPNMNVRSDCLKVLYEIGYLKPSLIQAYIQDFLLLLESKENRMIWGAFIALATTASLRPHEIWAHIDTVLAKFDQGSLITVVWGIKLFSSLAAAEKEYSTRLFPIMLHTLETCLPRDVPTHAENMLPAITTGSKHLILALLGSRQAEMTSSQVTRCRRVIKKIQSIA